MASDSRAGIAEFFLQRQGGRQVGAHSTYDEAYGPSGRGLGGHLPEARTVPSIMDEMPPPSERRRRRSLIPGTRYSLGSADDMQEAGKLIEGMTPAQANARFNPQQDPEVRRLIDQLLAPD